MRDETAIKNTPHIDTRHRRILALTGKATFKPRWRLKTEQEHIKSKEKATYKTKPEPILFVPNVPRGELGKLIKAGAECIMG